MSNLTKNEIKEIKRELENSCYILLKNDVAVAIMDDSYENEILFTGLQGVLSSMICKMPFSEWWEKCKKDIAFREKNKHLYKRFSDFFNGKINMVIK